MQPQRCGRHNALRTQVLSRDPQGTYEIRRYAEYSAVETDKKDASRNKSVRTRSLALVIRCAWCSCRGTHLHWRYECRGKGAFPATQDGASGGGNSQFFALANYIFGKANVKQEKMAMTTPVQMDPRTGTMSFIMPSNYWGSERLGSAPAAAEGAGVRLVAREEETVAVTTFGGRGRAGKPPPHPTAVTRRESSLPQLP